MIMIDSNPRQSRLPQHPVGKATSGSRRNSAWALPGILAALGLFQPVANAATSTKQDNSNALNLPASWDTMPGAADVAQWTSLVTGANNPVLGADLTWLGIKIVSPGGLVTLAAGNTLTVGASGIDLSAATQNLTINSGLTLQGPGRLHRRILTDWFSRF